MKIYAVTRNTDISVTKQLNLLARTLNMIRPQIICALKLMKATTRGYRTKGEKSLIELQIFNGASPMKSYQRTNVCHQKRIR